MKALMPAVTVLLLIPLVTLTQDARLIELPHVRTPGVGTLGDIDAQLPQGHIYRDNDRITWAHETSHGIASRIRGLYPGYNGFYLLNGQAFILRNPRLTLGHIAARTPIRGRSYQLYLVQQQQWWNDTPTYVFDEWVAYMNGSFVRLELGINSRGETVTQMIDFSIYSLTLCQLHPNPEWRPFIDLMMRRQVWLYERSNVRYDFNNFINTPVHKFSVEYLGHDYFPH